VEKQRRLKEYMKVKEEKENPISKGCFGTP
jgi:hypothetical protein